MIWMFFSFYLRITFPALALDTSFARQVTYCFIIDAGLEGHANGATPPSVVPTHIRRFAVGYATQLGRFPRNNCLYVHVRVSFSPSNVVAL